MPQSIADNFDLVRQLTGYQEPGTAVPTVDANLATVLANVAQNLRQFSHEIDRDRMMSDLDDATQVTPLPLLPSGLDGATNTNIELYPRIADEAWTVVTNPDAVDSTGVTGTIVYGKQSTYKNWKGGAIELSGGVATIYADSVMDTFPIDISGLGCISLVADITGAGTITDIELRLIDSLGGDTGYVALNHTVAKKWCNQLPNFVGADFTKITRVVVKVVTDANPVNHDKVFLFAIRAYNAGFDPSIGFGLNTIQGAVVVPVTYDLAAPSYGLTGDLVRGLGLASDPTPEDAEARILIDAGSLSATTGGNYHQVDLVLRQKVGEDTATRVEFYWNDTNCKHRVVTRVGGVDTIVHALTTVAGATYDAVIKGVDATGIFWLDARLKGDTLTVSLFASDPNEELLTRYYILGDGTTPFTDVRLVRFRGRVGYSFHPYDGDRDVLLYNYLGVILGLSTLTTSVFNSLTPVEGLQLFGSFAPDANLLPPGNDSFPQFVSGLVMDTSRTLSGLPTWKGSSGTSNTFVIPDFTQSYVDFDIWVPQDANASGDPLHIQLVGEGGPSNIPLPTQELQPGIWNRVEIDLSPYSGLGIDGGSYAVEVGTAGFTDLTWVFNLDYVTVGHRRVAWSASCDGGDNFYYFRDCVNDEDAALHFPRVNKDGGVGRGTQLVIQAEALTDDAWLSSFNVRVKYAELGKPIYY